VYCAGCPALPAPPVADTPKFVAAGSAISISLRFKSD
jgi:hypothetical protein